MASRTQEVRVRWVLPLLFMAAFWLAGGASGQPFEPTKWETLSVNTGANVRTGRSVDSSKIMVLSKGTTVRTATEYQDLHAGDIYTLEQLDWAEVELPDGRRGFIASHLLDQDDDGAVLALFWLMYSLIVVPAIARSKNRGMVRWALSSFFLFIPGWVIPFLPKVSKKEDQAPAAAAAQGAETVEPAVATPPPSPEPVAPEPPTVRRHSFKCANCGAQNEVSIGENDEVGAVICDYCGTPVQGP